ncbi:T9SS type A sorting domain-containing protein, partial [candidate division KSB1 bacterium]|nr:T9SS type A sorting domain-containing protein [candidate division KSB1 bacterium]
QVRQLVREKRQSGAFREEIRNAVLELLKEWGIEPPEKPDDPGALNKKYPTEKTVEAVNYPNPFNPTTRISYQVREPGNVSVEIFNIQGQMIRTLQDRYHESGEFSAHWDGLDDNGQAVASGTFIYRIHTPAGSVSKQMTLMK